MPKNRIITAIAFWLCMTALCSNAQQTPGTFVEIGAGMSMSSLRFLHSIKPGFNAQVGIGYTPFIGQTLLIPIDTIGNARSIHNVLDEHIRAYLFVSYTSKGETNVKIDNLEARGEINYFEIKPQGRYYIPLTPFYVGGGIFIGYAASRSLSHNGKPLRNVDASSYYHTADAGFLASGGGEIGVGHVRITGEISLEKGILNVSKTAKKKHTFALLLTAGVSMTILDKHFRHY